MERLENHKSVKEYITLENLQETEKFLRACVSVEQNKTPCYIREFSIQHFQDSKYFEQIESRIIKCFGSSMRNIRKWMQWNYWRNMEFINP